MNNRKNPEDLKRKALLKNSNNAYNNYWGREESHWHQYNMNVKKKIT